MGQLAVPKGCSESAYELIYGQEPTENEVDQEVITQCETSCSSNGNRMDSVSVFGCDCEQKQDALTTPWVLPPTPAGD